MRASLIEKGIAQKVLPFAQSEKTSPPLPASLPPPLPPPRNSTKKQNIYSNEIPVQQNRDIDCQTSPSLQRPVTSSSLQRPITKQHVNHTKHNIRKEEITVYYDQPPFFEKFCIYQGYNPTDLPVTFEPSVMCIHDNDSKTYESIQPNNNSSSSTEELIYSQEVTCKDVKKHCCYYIFCCGICCD